MTIEERVKLAEEKHHSGYNCAQAVLCSYSDKLGIDEETLFRLSEGFGAGMADMQGTCGAATGMYMIAGALGSSGAIEKGMTKGRTYQTVKGLTAAFDEKNGSHICKELKGIETGKVLRSCDGCIEDAVRIAERLFSQKKHNFMVKVHKN